MVHAGTSWEGVVWKVKENSPTARKIRLNKRAALVLSVLMIFATMPLTVLLSPSPAQAHWGNGCIAVGLGVGGSPPSGGGRMYCDYSGDNHYFYARIWKDIAYDYDYYVIGQAKRSFKAYAATYLSRYAGAGYYYSDAGVRYHDYDQSGRTYYR